LARAMKAGRGKRYCRGCRPSSVYGMQSSGTPLAVLSRHRPKFRHLHIKRNLGRRARHVDRSGDLCQSLSTFRVHCENLLLDTVECRSSTRLRQWLKRCRRSGQSIRAFGIASQRSKGRCGSTLIFSSVTKTSGIRVGSRVRSLTDARFPSSPPSVAAERIPVMREFSKWPALLSLFPEEPLTRTSVLTHLAAAFIDP
jgi:hypothetical protein